MFSMAKMVQKFDKILKNEFFCVMLRFANSVSLVYYNFYNLKL